MNNQEEVSQSEMELEIGTIDNRVVLHVKCALPITQPILMGFRTDVVDTIIETLKDAKQRALNYDEQLDSVG